MEKNCELAAVEGMAAERPERPEMPAGQAAYVVEGVRRKMEVIFTRKGRDGEDERVVLVRWEDLSAEARDEFAKAEEALENGKHRAAVCVAYGVFNRFGKEVYARERGDLVLRLDALRETPGVDPFVVDAVEEALIAAHALVPDDKPAWDRAIMAVRGGFAAAARETASPEARPSRPTTFRPVKAEPTDRPPFESEPGPAGPDRVARFEARMAKAAIR